MHAEAHGTDPRCHESQVLHSPVPDCAYLATAAEPPFHCDASDITLPLCVYFPPMHVPRSRPAAGRTGLHGQEGERLGAGCKTHCRAFPARHGLPSRTKCLSYTAPAHMLTFCSVITTKTSVTRKVAQNQGPKQPLFRSSL